MDPSDPIETLPTHMHTMKYDTSLRGHQATAETLPFRFQRAASWPVALSQSETNPDSSPDTIQSPPGLVDRHRTRASCLFSRMARYVGKGRRDCGEGSEGIRDSGSILSFVLWTLGARYRSNNRLKRSLIKSGYAGTSRSAEYFSGR